MDAYGSFAMVYDLFMDNVDYDGWSDYLRKLLRRYGVEDGLILELGCGTGSMTERLAEAGFDMIGVDCLGGCWRSPRRRNVNRDWIFCIWSRICGNWNCMGLCGQW